MFHVNPATGKAGKCTAKKGGCPFGSVDEHFTSAEAARSAYEKSMAGKEHKPVTKPAGAVDGRSVRGDWADIELYRNRIEKHDEVFVHPQGKIAIISDDTGRMSVYKAGKKASTSGTQDDLRNGRGAWKRVKDTHDRLMSSEDYNKQFGNTASSSNPPVTARATANIAAGYPADSQLDASKRRTIKQSTPSSNWRYTSKDPASILPVDEMANPHKDFKSSYWLTGWNSPAKDGSASLDISTFEVWSSVNDSGHVVHKLVTTSGNTVSPLGSESYFAHDQTGARMGKRWTMIGAFKAEEGGEAFGEIPDKKMPINTYK
jgi:hypothetical protein